jgi:hypothetical protein
VERITCDNPECVEYVDELIREEPGKVRVARVRASPALASGMDLEGGARFLSVPPGGSDHLVVALTLSDWAISGSLAKIDL